MTPVTFTAGCLIRRRVRTLLQAALWAGSEFEWFEVRGWLESEFVLRGRDAAVVAGAIGRAI